jgi:hypothetical protein
MIKEGDIVFCPIDKINVRITFISDNVVWAEDLHKKCLGLPANGVSKGNQPIMYINEGINLILNAKIISDVHI